MMENEEGVSFHPTERMKLRVLETRLVAARQHRDMLPAMFDMRKFERDAGLTVALGECLGAIEEMREAVRDTLGGVAQRAFEAGSTAYAHIKIAATSAQSLKRTVEKMGARSTSLVSREPAAVETAKPVEPSGTAPPVLDIVSPADKAA